MDATASTATLLRDLQNCIPLSNAISQGDNIVLLTPVVVPTDSSSGHDPLADPFEALGRALLSQLPRPQVHHVPYTARGGISQAHVDIINMNHASLVIFVVSGPPSTGQTSQLAMAEVLLEGTDQHPLLVLACCSVDDLGHLETVFPTIVETPNYSPAALAAAADLLFHGEHRDAAEGQNLALSPQEWEVQDLHVPHDFGPGLLESIHELWLQTFGKQYLMTARKLQSLLMRAGYATHYGVQERDTGTLVGFCATYTTFLNSDEEHLVGSLAVIMVKPEYRRRGIGSCLYDRALNRLSAVRGVCRIQLGTTFPRLMCGLPTGSPAEGWFRQRDWNMDQALPGRGQEVCDWLLDFNDYRGHAMDGSLTADIRFRSCEPQDYTAALGLVSVESVRNDCMGWYDQYMQMGQGHARDIIVGVSGDGIIAAALVYTPTSESPVARDLPWAGTISERVGGASCICISGNTPMAVRHGIVLRMLDACIAHLKGQGMRAMFLDAIKAGEDEFKRLGFRKWAAYKDAWRLV